MAETATRDSRYPLDAIDRVTAHARVDKIRDAIRCLADDALDSNCPLAFIDRLHDCETVLDVVADYIKAGPRRERD